MFYREGLLAPRPTPKLEDNPLSAVCDCLFNLFAATLHIGGHSSIRNLRTRHAVVTGTHYTCFIIYITTAWCAVRIVHLYSEIQNRFSFLNHVFVYNCHKAYKCAERTLLSDLLSVLQEEITRKLPVRLKRVCQLKEMNEWSSVLWFALTVSVSISARSTIIKHENLFEVVWEVLL